MPLVGLAQATGQGELPIDGDESAPILLNPFEVSAADDRGYLAASSLSGSRTATSLKNIGAPMSAFTQQFMEDAGITNTAELAEFMVSTERNWGEQAGPQNGVTTNDNVMLRMRGLPGGRSTVNFFNADMRFDKFSMDRVDQSRGPNSILFGIGAPGGLLNVTPKTAILSRMHSRFELTGRSWDGFRQQADINVPIVNDTFGIRLAAVHSEQESWRHWEYDDHERFFATLRWQIAPQTEFNFSIEDGIVNKATKRSYTAYDAYTPWVEGGRQLSDTANAAAGIQLTSGGPFPVFDTETGTMQNWRRKTSSQRLRFGNIPIAMTDFSVLPRETVIYGPGNDQTTDYTMLISSFTHSFGDSLSVELAGFDLRQSRLVYDPNPNASLYLSVDTNATLPNGDPNPNAGRTYLETLPLIKDSRNPADAVRLSVAYDFDLRRFGRHKLAGVAQYGHDLDDNVTSAEYILDNPYHTSRPEHGWNRVYRRTYVDLDGPTRDIVMADWRDTPISGLPILAGTASDSRDSVTTGFIPFNIATRINSNTNTSLIGMLQSQFFSDRLHTVVGVSRDKQKSYTSSLERGDPFGPFAAGVPYALPGTTPTHFEADNVSFSGVFHVNEWLGVSYNQSANAALPGGGVLDTPTGRPPIPRGKSKDVGLRFDLFDNRVYLTATYYETSANKNSAFNGVRAGDINPIWSALDEAGVLTADGLFIDDVLNTTTITTFDSAADGIEIELVANLTDNWRLLANFNHGEIRLTNIGEEMRRYIAENRPYWESNGSVPLPNPVGSATTVAGYLDILDDRVFQEFDLPDGGLERGQALSGGNLRTNYTFDSGALEGLSVGGGLRFRGKAVTSYMATADAQNNITATAVYRDPQTYADLNLGYRGRGSLFNKRVDWSLQLNVNNVFDRDDIIPLITTDTGSIVTYRLPTPREYVLTARFNF